MTAVGSLPAPIFFYVLYVKYMTSSVPDSFNLDQLSEFLENAQSEDDIHSEASNGDKELTPEFIDDCAMKALDFASDLCSDPLVHKVMMLMIAQRMVEWHTAIGQKQFEIDEIQSGVCWLRDAGKFQAMLDSLVSISIGPDDHTIHQCN